MGRAKDVKIAGDTYSTNDYLLTDTTTVTTTYATGEKMKVETDRFNQPIKTTYIDADDNSEVLLETEYDSLGRVTKAIDKAELITYNYKYDGFGNVTESDDGETFIYNYYDSNNRLTSYDIQGGDLYQTVEPIYEKNLDGIIYPDNVIVGIKYTNEFASETKRDNYGRTEEKTLSIGEDNILTESYRYLQVPNDESFLLTNLVRAITYNHGENEETVNYTYDNNGNITCVTKDFDVLVRYEYDEMNQLIREDNKQLNRSFIYRYDNAGNIILKDEHEYIYGEETATLSRKEYTYSDTGWKDKLTSFDGQSITYDALGNPLSYLGHTLTWDRVRQLKTFDNNTFAYDGFGKRSRKNSVYYLYDSDKLIKERRNGTSLVYFYDTTGVCGFRYHDFAGENDLTTYYFYRKNLQGDVTAILNQNGNIVAEYLYDAWGKCYITYDPTGIGAINPIRYRSYYYDTETGLYYLNSRYYDPNTSRFINADVVFDDGAGLLGYNLYAYCANNPVIYKDDNGTGLLLAITIGFVVGSLVSGAFKVYSNKKSNKEWYDGLAITMLAGGVGGAISCVTIPGVSTWVCATVFGAAGNVATNLILGEVNSIEDLTFAIMIGAGAGLLGETSARLLTKGITKYFGGLTKAKQKAFLNSIGNISNRDLNAIRKIISKGLTPEILNDLVDKYGYAILASAFVSSIGTSIDWEGVIS